jgi:microcystin-dependent protein
MHPGRGPGLTSRRLGQKLGTETVTLSELQIPSHSHTLRVHAGGSTPVGPSVTASLANSRTINAWQTNTTANLVTMAPETLSNTGGGQSHTNVQPYLTLNFIIALQGLYPSRS